MQLTAILVAFLTVALLYVSVRRASGRRRIYLPDALVAATASHTIGAMIIFGQSGTAAATFIVWAALLSFACVSLTTIAVLAISKSTRPTVSAEYFRSRTAYNRAIIGVALANLLIIAMIFSNPAIARLIIATFTATDDTTLLVVRKAITASTEGYMSPGLIKLVRDLISPIVIVAFILSRPRAARSFLLWIAVFLTMAAILIGGQRFPMLMLMAAIALGFIGRRAIEGQARGFKPLQVLKIATPILFLFFLMTSLLGRTNANASGLMKVEGTIVSLLDRAFVTVPREAGQTFHFWSEIGPTWGASWIADLAILLPGAQTTSLSNQLHEMLGGSAQGNSVLFFAADAWLAFGWVGVVIASILFVLLLHSIDRLLWGHRSPRNDAARVVMFLNIPMMYSPFLFVLYGGAVVLPIAIWSAITRKKPGFRKRVFQARRDPSEF